MFTQPAAPPTPLGSGNLSVASVSVSPAPPSSRSSRLRGLSYLRNYTQTHLLSREHSSSSGSTSQLSSSSPSQPAIAGPITDSSTRTNRLSQLVPAFAHPLGLPTPPSPSVARNHTAPATGIAPGGRPNESPAIPPCTTTTTTTTTTTETAGSGLLSDDMTRARSATTGDALGRQEGGSSMDILPSIRFSTFFDPRATRPSLKFNPISRTLPTGTEVIRVGRYSERDNQPNVPSNVPSAAPVGFKSKVVSRRHCEFWYENGKWYIKDVKSSSGTFLNHIRLSPPGTESKPYPVNDGDIVQLGIDFKGGEEMIFRCVKMRLELNRGWQSKLNTFNMTTHKRLRNMTAGSANNAAGQSYSQDCSICLNSIAPCQCLFVAPCSHTWHYKCIRSLLASPSYPIFICPNCRAAADLEAEVEDPEEWEQLDSDEGGAQQEGALLQAPPPNHTDAPPRRSWESVRGANRMVLSPPQQSAQQQQVEVPEVTMLFDSPPQLPLPASAQIDISASSSAGVLLPSPAVALPSSNLLPQPTPSNPMPIPAATVAQQKILPPSGIGGDGRREGTRTPSPTGAPVVMNGHEGPITPRNDAGPWVFDGSGVRLRADGSSSGNGNGTPVGTANSLEAAVTQQQQGGGRPRDDGIS
ncbi:E3 ubiquitin-protein ligase DMA2 [Madurella mycetomatis]|uniref:RING-type E3 ubiquitin transferase n=1 Tax=Madurella mycetomatis TaxID=100816 RepID=A0A175W6N8_9PEZI|nr:E3 ubiquitin-protein ligase DMA2 [Madurella mycetomatis]